MTTQSSYPIITPFEAVPTAIDGLYIITMKQVTDERGTVRELFRQSAMDSTPLPQFGPWKQINATQTNRGSIRGLHAEAMNKLVAVVAGEAFGVYVDARIDSPTVGAVVTVPLTKGVQVFVPQGVCNGFSIDKRATLPVPLLLRRRVAAWHARYITHTTRPRAWRRLAHPDRHIHL